MKNTKKITLAGLGAACALTLSLGVGFLANNGIAKADSSSYAPDGTTYFYDNLLTENGTEYTLAKKFYKVLEDLNKNGEFLDGVVDYKLSDDIATSKQIESWVNGTNLEVPKAFSAARDAFFVEHPEVFYIDFTKITISVAKSDGEYVGFINSGREANLYYDNGFRTLSAVEEAVAKFNTRIDEIVAEMNKREEVDLYTARDAYLAKEVNSYLAENIKYDYVTYDHKDDPNYIAAANINTAYGGLVEGKAVCGGFSFAYKVIMDKLGIPCINVKGYSNNQEKDENGKLSGTSVGHMWNYVWLETPDVTAQETKSKARAAASKTAQSKERAATGDGAWYSVDVTWDNASANKYRYALMNVQKDEEIHVTDGVISSSGYKLTYPELSELGYGYTNANGFVTSIEYTPYSDGSVDDFGNPLQYLTRHVSYNGKSAAKLLEEDGLYIAYRDSYYAEDGEIVWTDWTALEVIRQFYIKDAQGGDIRELFNDTGDETAYYDNTSGYCTQYAVFDVKPDRELFGEYGSHDPETESWYFFLYNEETLNNNKAVAISDTYINETYGTYTVPPYINSANTAKQTLSDSMRDKDGFVAESKAFVLSYSYDQPLELLDPSKPIGVSFTSEHPNAQQYSKFYPVSKDSNGEDVYVVLSESKEGSGIFDTLTFKFAPSLMYEHDQEKYFFNFTNVGSARMVNIMKDGQPTGEQRVSHKAPNTASETFGRVLIACPAFFNYDGRLYIDCCAVPTLVSQTDLSEDNFKDENGNNIFTENERSQMMLVAEKASTDTVDEMLNGIGDIEGSNVTKDDIKSSETYDISLRMCGKYQTIPDKSYVKIALGFPEGYGPNDEGVTFKIFHRKHVVNSDGTEEYIIEEIPCVVTQFGIVATVTSFSPYMVAVVDADKATDKTVYASIEGKGGRLTMEDGKIRSINEGESYTYTIQPDEGYQIYSVTLNSKNVSDKVVNGKLTLGYADLDTNNQLVIQYIANEAAARIQQKLDDKVIDEDVTVNATQYVINVPVGGGSDPLPEQPKSHTTAIIIAVVCGVVVVALGVALAVVLVRKKQN